MLEVMSGTGRHIPVFTRYHPGEITCVDICQGSIEILKTKYPDVEAFQGHLIDWITNFNEGKYKLTVGIWCLAYLSKKDIDYFL